MSARGDVNFNHKSLSRQINPNLLYIIKLNWCFMTCGTLATKQILIQNLLLKSSPNGIQRKKINEMKRKYNDETCYAEGKH